MRFRVLLLVLIVAAGGAIAGAKGIEGDPLDPVRNVALPCEAVATPGLVPRSAKNLAHVANVCGFVGTDIEFQSRRAADGTVHDYAFVGTMGGGTRIFDITDPAHPGAAGRYTDPGYQNDVSVRGDLLVLGFDSLGVSGATSSCLHGKGAGTGGQTRAGIDIVRLVYDAASATFTTRAHRLLPVELRLGRRAHDHDPSIAASGSRSIRRSSASRSWTSGPARPTLAQFSPRRSSTTPTTCRSRGTAGRSTRPASIRPGSST